MHGRLVGPQVRTAVDAGLQDGEVGLGGHRSSVVLLGLVLQLVGEVASTKATSRALGEVEAGPGRQGVHDHAGDQQRRAVLGQVRVADRTGSRRRRTRSPCPPPRAHGPPDDRGGVLVDAEPEQAGRPRDQGEQPAVPVALPEVLVDDDVGQQAEAGRRGGDALPRGVRRPPRRRSCARSRRSRPRTCRRPRRRGRTPRAPPSPNARAGDDGGELELVAAGHEHRVDVGEGGCERRVVGVRAALGAQTAARAPRRGRGRPRRTRRGSRRPATRRSRPRRCGAVAAGEPRRTRAGPSAARCGPRPRRSRTACLLETARDGSVGHGPSVGGGRGHGTMAP